MRWLSIAVASAVLAMTAPVLACPGDCNADGAVAVDEVVRGVTIALGSAPLATCPAFDGNGDAAVTIGELIAATNALLTGCPAASPTVTSAATATPTPTETATPTATPTATIDRPIELASPFVYRGIAGEPVARAIDAIDPDGHAVHCTAATLPAGMALADGVLRWTPADDQVGLLTIPLACANDAEPPVTNELGVDFRIAPRAACALPACDAARGCTTTLPPVADSCCDQQERARVPELVRNCPQDRVLQIGQSTEGFGRVHDCDRMRFRTAAQASATLQFHLRVSCINPFVRAHLRVRLENATRGVLVDYEALVAIPTTPVDGFYELRRVTVPFAVDGPYFSIEDTEANLTVTLEDSTGAVVSDAVRVQLTSAVLPDLPD